MPRLESARRRIAATAGKSLAEKEYTIPSDGISPARRLSFKDFEVLPEESSYSFPGMAKLPEKKPALSPKEKLQVDDDIAFAAKVAARLEASDAAARNPSLVAQIRAEIDKTSDKLKLYPTTIAAALKNPDRKAGAVAAGKLYSELANNPPASPSVAARAALLFSAAGDDERAARMYRQVIELADLVPGDAASQKLAVVAKDYLRSQNLSVKPKYPYQKLVNSKYTTGTDGTRAPNGRNIEEDTPQEDVVDQMTRCARHVASGRFDLDDYKRYLVLFGCKPPTVTNREVHQVVVEALATECKGTGADNVAAYRARLSALNFADDLLDNFDAITLRNVAPSNYKSMMKELADRRVQYLKSTEDRNAVEILGERGLLVRKLGGKLDTDAMSSLFGGEGCCIYVMSADGRMYVNSGILNKIHHSSFLAGTETSGAGELQVKGGVLVSINNKSGHYQPQVVHLAQSLHEMQSRGINIQGTKVTVYALKASTGIAEPEEFENGKAFLDLYKGDRAQFRKLWKERGFSTDPYDGVDELDFGDGS